MMRTQSRKSQSHKGKAIVGGVLGITLVAAGGFWWVSQAGQTQFRTAVAETATVSQTVSVTGKVSSVGRADAYFSAAGTVSTVEVSVGDTVTAGQTLATLDPTDLESSVETAKDELASAEEQLEDDLEIQANGGTSTSTSTTENSGGTAVASGASSPSISDLYTSDGAFIASTVADTSNTSSSSEIVTAAQATVVAAQEELLTQYAVVEDILLSATTDVDQMNAADSVCALFLSAEITDSISAAELADIQENLTACQELVDTAQTSSTELNIQQKLLLDKVDTLNQAVEKLNQAIANIDAGNNGQEPQPSESPTSSPTDGNGTPNEMNGGPEADDGTQNNFGQGMGTDGQGSSGQEMGADSQNSAGGTSQSGQTTTVTAATILADKAAITLAEIQVTVAEQELANAQLTAPIAGTVAAINIAQDSSVTTSDSSAAVTILGPDGYNVTATIPLNQVRNLAVGQALEATTVTSSEPLSGTISMIGIVNQSSTSTLSFTVTMALDTDSETELLEDSSASAVIKVAEQTDVLTVPTSAISRSTTGDTVQILSEGQLEELPVTIGAVGTERTEITSGLESGQEVVLADLSKSLDEDDTSTSSESFVTVEMGGDFPSGGGFEGGSFEPPN